MATKKKNLSVDKYRYYDCALCIDNKDRRDLLRGRILYYYLYVLLGCFSFHKCNLLSIPSIWYSIL